MKPIDVADEELAIEVAAPLEAVWGLVSDVARTPEWSPVVQRIEWLGDATTVEAGAKFQGDNKFGGFRWTRECVVTEVEPPRVFGFCTLGPDGQEQTRWRYGLEPGSSGGTRLTLGYQSVTLPRWIRVLQRIPGTAKTSARRATENLQGSLDRIEAILCENA
ncbi:MAG: SRPBCC family protein [Acidimicrobiales bacterium]